MGLAKDENIVLPPSVVLVDPSGNFFRTKYNKWASGRLFYAGGWSRLFTQNDIGKKDICICKF